MSYPLGSVEPDPRIEFYAAPEAPQARPRLRGLATGLGALLVMVLLAGGMWFAYLQGMRHASGGSAEDVPLIRADARPTKMKPEKPGGMQIPDRDKLIYTQKRAAVEHLLPPPEKPMPRPAAQGTPTLQSETAQPAPGSATTAVATSTAASAASPTGKIAAVAAKVPTNTPPAPTKASGPRIQIATVRSEESAIQEWNRIKRTNADLLGNLSAVPVRVGLGEKGVLYRVQSAPVADADRLCRELNQRNVGCIVAR